MDTAIRLTDSTIGKRAKIWSGKGMFSPPATQPTEKCDWQVSQQQVCSSRGRALVISQKKRHAYAISHVIAVFIYTIKRRMRSLPPALDEGVALVAAGTVDAVYAVFTLFTL